MKKVFAERLRELIGDNSVHEFAKMLGMPPQTVDRYVKEQRTPTGDAIVTVCKKCGVSADWLLGLPVGAAPNDTCENQKTKTRESRKVSALRASLRNAVQAAETFAKIVKDLEKEL